LLLSLKKIHLMDGNVGDQSRITDAIMDAQSISPEAIRMLANIANHGSMAAAARAMQLVPSALTHRVRLLEAKLDVLLFDRSTRNALLTPAGKELLREGAHVLATLDGLANRVKRIATGWEPQLTLAVDSIIVRTVVWQLCEQFFALGAPTRLRIREETLSGTMAALLDGSADLALGAVDFSGHAGIIAKPLGEMSFVFVVAPHHPLALAQAPITDSDLASHRIVAVADSASRGLKITVGILPGQEVFTVPNLQAKLDAQLRGMGCGYLPICMAQPFLSTGTLVQKATENPPRTSRISYAWPAMPKAAMGKAIRWWLDALESPRTRAALLSNAG
jgi:DNA-binding transcriptional LysR family regulator